MICRRWSKSVSTSAFNALARASSSTVDCPPGGVTILAKGVTARSVDSWLAWLLMEFDLGRFLKRLAEDVGDAGEGGGSPAATAAERRPVVPVESLSSLPSLRLRPF